ncbi:E3 ubiquitin-protein ligase sina [Anabrus simplex]|uniref:E3 ubiquitin-protein ligase sina n=1 Tax=Anabrus simplex TaxID=316456 RepID=UPI0035A36727
MNEGTTGIKFKCSKDVQTDTIQLANIELSKIWSILECPVCLEVALPPIYQCDKGHHACNNCWKKLKSCPLCKSYRSMMSRNFVAEAIAEVVVLPCRFHIEGCSETVLLIDKPQHEAVCFHRTHQCPVQGCKESYSYHNMTCHLSEKHGYTVKVKTQAVTECRKKFSEVITMFSLTPLVHAYNILGWGLFFLCHNSLRSTAALWMQMIPTTQDQASFKYQVEVMDHLGCRGVSYTGAVANMDKTVDEILQKDEFLTVPNNILKSLKQHHNLKITIRIWP